MIGMEGVNLVREYEYNAIKNRASRNSAVFAASFGDYKSISRNATHRTPSSWLSGGYSSILDAAIGALGSTSGSGVGRQKFHHVKGGGGSSGCQKQQHSSSSSSLASFASTMSQQHGVDLSQFAQLLSNVVPYVQKHFGVDMTKILATGSGVRCYGDGATSSSSSSATATGSGSSNGGWDFGGMVSTMVSKVTAGSGTGTGRASASGQPSQSQIDPIIQQHWKMLDTSAADATGMK